MCVAILHKQGAEILTKDSFMGYARANPDGFGLLYVDNLGVLRSEKTLDKDAFWIMYETIFKEINKNSPMLVHFRLSTSGGKNLDNCHPFIVNENVGFIHNGVISIERQFKEYSDTYNFNECILKGVGDDIMTNTTTQELIRDWVGYSNKLLFLSSKKETFILNESEGEWSKDKKTWFSFKTYTYSAQSRYSVFEPYIYDESEIVTCKVCHSHIIQNKTVVLINNHGISFNVCNHCLTHSTKISDIMYIKPEKVGA